MCNIEAATERSRTCSAEGGAQQGEGGKGGGLGFGPTWLPDAAGGEGCVKGIVGRSARGCDEDADFAIAQGF